MTTAYSRALAAEAIGTGLLVATVVGSGIMAAKLSGGNVGAALLAYAIATGAILVMLITMLGPVSGAHFNPVVSLVMVLRRDLSASYLLPFVVAQVVGVCIGTWLAHAMFDLPIPLTSTTQRSGAGQWIAEAVAAFGLIGTIIGVSRAKPEAVPSAVGL